MAEIVTPFGVGFMVDETSALQGKSFHRDITSATERAKTLAEAYPGRVFEVHSAIEVRCAPDGEVEGHHERLIQRVVGLASVSRREFSLSVVDIDGTFPGHELSRLHSSLGDALLDLDRSAHRHPGRRFGLYVIAQTHRIPRVAASDSEAVR